MSISSSLCHFQVINIELLALQAVFTHNTHGDFNILQKKSLLSSERKKTPSGADTSVPRAVVREGKAAIKRNIQNSVKYHGYMKQFQCPYLL